MALTTLVSPWLGCFTDLKPNGSTSDRVFRVSYRFTDVFDVDKVNIVSE